jgi:hypothetical protein
MNHILEIDSIYWPVNINTVEIILLNEWHARLSEFRSTFIGQSNIREFSGPCLDNHSSWRTEKREELYPSTNRDQRLKVLILGFQLRQLMEISTQRLIPSIFVERLIHISPWITQGNTTIGVDLCKGTIDMRDFLCWYIIDEISS